MIDMENISSLVPHRGKMLLLSKVNAYNLQEERIEAEYHLTENCLFYDPVISGVPAWVGFEFIAQTISAYKGIKTIIKGEPVKLGFILGVSQLRTELSLFKTGSILVIKAQEFENMDPVFIYEGEIFIEGKKVLAGKLTVMEVDEKKALAMKEGSDSIG
jgi:predicted hotdog family 3-hydroxylacyl-ACP dehydratase